MTGPPPAGRRPVAALTLAAPLLVAQSGAAGLQGWLDQPTVAFLLLVVGTASLLVEATNPGIVGTGVLGLLCVLAGLYSLSLQDVRGAGLLLVALALVLYAVEVFAPGTLVAAVAGTLALAAGGLLLIEGGEGVPALVVLPVALLSGAAAFLGGRFAARMGHLPSRFTGPDQLVGRQLTVAAADDDAPRAFTEGTWWSLRRADGGALPPGATVTVIALDGLTLVVEPPPIGGPPPPSPPTPTPGAP